MTSNESSQRSTPELEGTNTPEKEESSKEGIVGNDEDSDTIDDSIPDCSNWTCDEVYTYFLKYVMPEEANVFRDQVIYILLGVQNFLFV